jgi:serine/threonine-protein kinase
VSLTNGTRLGPYEILAPIGAGGMGEVYKALDTRLDRFVAVKVISDRLGGEPSAIVRFEREAKAVAALSHPNILAIHDYGKEGDVSYAVMELLEGETLRDRLSRGHLPGLEAQEIALQIASGLVAAHEKGIIHRDLKPGNIFLMSAGHVKILDFGLARLITKGALAGERPSAVVTEDLQTHPGTALGTVGYMAPEQARGLPTDARSDIFAFGVVLYEMLAGKPPFERDSAIDTLAAILKEDPPPIPGLCSETLRLIERCLRKDTAERFQSAAELKVAIESGTVTRSDIAGPSIAVFPFVNMTGTKKDDYLCEGLAEEIINDLARIPGLRVIARTSAFAVGRMGLDVREAGARLNVGSILEGSVRREGRRGRMAVQLVATSDGSHLWSERYDRELTDILALEEEIAASVAARLRGELMRGDRQRRHPETDAEAQAAYLEGRYYFARGTPEALAKAKACYELAIARAPGFALAYDSLAELFWFLGFFGNVPPREAFSQSTWHAMRALELDDTLAQTHALLGMLRKELDYNWPEVERELRRARDLDRESPLVRLRYAISLLLPQGRVAEAMAEIEGMLATDPLSLFVRWWVAVTAHLARHSERAVEEGRHMIALDPTHFLGHWALGIGLNDAGAVNEAVASLERAHDLSGGIPFTLGFLAYVYGRAGRRDDARRLLEHARTLSETGYVPPTTFLMGYVGLEDWDAAFEWMDKAIEGRDPIIMPIKSFPFLDPVRGDERFRSLLRRMHLE